MGTVNQTQIIAETGKQEIIVTREFEAPRALVYEAFSRPEWIVQWMGPREMKARVEKLELNPPGSWRFLMTRPDGVEMAFSGCIHEAHFPERMIRTFEFEGLPERGHVSLEFLTLEALPEDRTKAVFHIIYRTVADRDAIVDIGMESEFRNDHERLDSLFANLKNK